MFAWSGAPAPWRGHRSSRGTVPRASPMRCIRRQGGALPAERTAALMLAPEAPYPLAGGGALRTASLLQYMARHYETDLIVFRQPGAPDPAQRIPAGLLRRIHVLDLPANRRDLLSKSARNA